MICLQFRKNLAMYLSFKCKLRRFDPPAPILVCIQEKKRRGKSHQTLLPEKKTLVVRWHVHLTKKTLKSYINSTNIPIIAWFMLVNRNYVDYLLLSPGINHFFVLLK